MEPERLSTSGGKTLRDALVSVLGEDRLSTADRGFYSADIYGGDKLAGFIIRPETTAQLSAAARAVTSSGY